MANLCWLYYISKLTEFADTVRPNSPRYFHVISCHTIQYHFISFHIHPYCTQAAPLGQGPKGRRRKEPIRERKNALTNSWSLPLSKSRFSLCFYFSCCMHHDHQNHHHHHLRGIFIFMGNHVTTRTSLVFLKNGDPEVLNLFSFNFA